MCLAFGLVFRQLHIAGDRHPLRVVLYDASLANGPTIPSWLAKMKERVELVRNESLFPEPIGRNASAPFWQVYEFAPEAGSLAQSPEVLDTRIP